MSSVDHAVHDAEAFVGSMLSIGFASVAVSMQRAARVADQDVAYISYLNRVDANARAAVRQNAAGFMSGTDALIEAYNRRRRATAQK